MSKTTAKKTTSKPATEKTSEMVDKLVKKEVEALRVRSRVSAGHTCQGGWCTIAP
jgi:hypothetical protein